MISTADDDSYTTSDKGFITYQTDNLYFFPMGRKTVALSEVLFSYLSHYLPVKKALLSAVVFRFFVCACIPEGRSRDLLGSF